MDAVRVAGVMLIVALYAHVQKEPAALAAAAHEQERKRRLDATVLASVIG